MVWEGGRKRGDVILVYMYVGVSEGRRKGEREGRTDGQGDVILHVPPSLPPPVHHYLVAPSLTPAM